MCHCRTASQGKTYNWTITYNYGIPEHFTWHVLDGSADNSTILVDVATNWRVEGAMILTQSPVLPPDADVTFAEMVERHAVPLILQATIRPLSKLIFLSTYTVHTYALV